MIAVTPPPASLNAFRALIAGLATEIGDAPLDAALEARLNARAPADGPLVRAVFEACRAAIAEGWMCDRQAGGIRYGRVLKPSPEWGGYSVDVVEMDNLVGPHHRHPRGEIDLLMPLEGPAEFDGSAGPWKVYGPGTAHRPTVSKGRALVLYLLPQGEIEFTRG